MEAKSKVVEVDESVFDECEDLLKDINKFQVDHFILLNKMKNVE